MELGGDFERDVGIRVVIDTNVINARGRDDSMNQLEHWPIGWHGLRHTFAADRLTGAAANSGAISSGELCSGTLRGMTARIALSFGSESVNGQAWATQISE